MNIHDFNAIDAWLKNPNSLDLAENKKTGNLTTSNKFIDTIKHFFGFGKSSTMERVEQVIAAKIEAAVKFEVTPEQKALCENLVLQVQTYHGKEQHPATKDTNVLITNLKNKIAICDAREQLKSGLGDVAAQKKLVLALYDSGEKVEANRLAETYRIDKDPDIQKKKAGNIQAIAQMGFGKFKPFNTVPPQA